MKGEGRERKKESEAGERETELEGRERILILVVVTVLTEAVGDSPFDVLECSRPVALICDKETTCEHITVLS